LVLSFDVHLGLSVSQPRVWLEQPPPQRTLQVKKLTIHGNTINEAISKLLAPYGLWGDNAP